MFGSMKLTLPLLFALCTSPVLAQSKPEVIYWPAAKLGGYSATLKGRQTEKKTTSASEILSDLGNHKFEILRRDGSGAGELHQNWTDVFVVQGGEATILYGGSIENAKDTGNGEIRGPRHVGGTSQKVAAGDVLVMPPGIAHQTIVEPGKSFFVLIVKVQR
jgi:mannose-6-phosphate isomerase-like protein (cupin superfamily)